VAEDDRQGSGTVKSDGQEQEADVDYDARISESFEAGNFTLREDEARYVADELGLEVEFFEEPEVSATAGNTPATGSGGIPYRADAATDETKKFARDRKKQADKEDGGELTGGQKVRARALAAAVKE
jgi:hypothetical protein